MCVQVRRWAASLIRTEEQPSGLFGWLGVPAGTPPAKRHSASLRAAGLQYDARACELTRRKLGAISSNLTISVKPELIDV
jgi:hypothetical protein